MIAMVLSIFAMPGAVLSPASGHTETSQQPCKGGETEVA